MSGEEGQDAEAVRLLDEVLECIDADPYDVRGGIADELREIRALLIDGEVCDLAHVDEVDRAQCLGRHIDGSGDA